jgi:hypothetical protein
MDYRAKFLTIPLLTSALHPVHAGLTTPESNAPKKSMTAHQPLTLSSFFKPEPKGYRQTASPVQYTFKGAVADSINYIHLCTATNDTCSVCTTNYQVINAGKAISYTTGGTLYGIPAASVAAYLATQGLPGSVGTPVTYNVGMYLQSKIANCTGPAGATYCSTNIDTATPQLLPHVLCMQATYNGTSVTALHQTDNKIASLTTPAPPVTVPAFPQKVIATAGSGQVTVSWTPPNNPYNLQPQGDGVVTGYKVLYGRTRSSVFTTPGCTTTTATTCTVSELSPGVSYTFTVSATNAKGTGPASYSSPVIPLSADLNANPSTLALSGLGGGAARTITITNNTLTSVTLSNSVAINPGLPSETEITRNDCNSMSLPPGGSCSITILPGREVTMGAASRPCTTGIVPSNVSVLTVTGSGSNSVSANVFVLGYGCRYQGGYLFSIDDTTPPTSSIGGQVVSVADQSNSALWSPGGDLTSIWGIDYTSTIAAPSPNAIAAPDTSIATYTLGQLNCNAENDGACATNNIVTHYSPVDTYSLNGYAAGICRQPIDSSGAVCAIGNNCYRDWYLPSICDLGPFGSSGNGVSPYPYSDGNYLACASSNNIQNNLAGTSIVTNFSAGFYWSSTEDRNAPQTVAWNQQFTSGGGAQFADYAKYGQLGVRCVRALTL